MSRCEMVGSIRGRVPCVVGSLLVWLVALPLFAVLFLVKSSWVAMGAAWQDWRHEVGCGIRFQLDRERNLSRCWRHLRWFRSTPIRFRDVDPPFGRFHEVVGREEEGR